MTPQYHINLFWSEADGAWVAMFPICDHVRRSTILPRRPSLKSRGDGGLARSHL
jgi:hypothetical protein